MVVVREGGSAKLRRTQTQILTLRRQLLLLVEEDERREDIVKTSRTVEIVDGLRRIVMKVGMERGKGKC
jgi:hypothetical protein